MRRTHLTGLISICTTLSVLAALAACTVPTRVTQGRNVIATARQPTSAAGPDWVLVGAGESITIQNALADQTHYLCETGRPLSCSGFGRKRFCFCPWE